MSAKFLIVFVVPVIECVLLPCHIGIAAEPTGWDSVPAILESIKPPTFPDRDFAVADYGAVGDGQTDCRPAFDKAIAACHEAGGGRVVVPAGDWLVSGPIHLKSNVNLHLAAGATVRFSTDPADYLPAVLARFEGNEVMNYSPFLYAYRSGEHRASPARARSTARPGRRTGGPGRA